MANDDNTHTRGAVKDPEHDGRLKENRDSGVSKTSGEHEAKASGSHEADDSNHTPGAVRDPEHDGRLKQNRDKGVHVSDA